MTPQRRRPSVSSSRIISPWNACPLICFTELVANGAEFQGTLISPKQFIWQKRKGLIPTSQGATWAARVSAGTRAVAWEQAPGPWSGEGPGKQLPAQVPCFPSARNRWIRALQGVHASLRAVKQSLQVYFHKAFHCHCLSHTASESAHGQRSSTRRWRRYWNQAYAFISAVLFSHAFREGGSLK